MRVKGWRSRVVSEVDASPVACVVVPALLAQSKISFGLRRGRTTPGGLACLALARRQSWSGASESLQGAHRDRTVVKCRSSQPQPQRESCPAQT